MVRLHKRCEDGGLEECACNIDDQFEGCEVLLSKTEDDRWMGQRCCSSGVVVVTIWWCMFVFVCGAIRCAASHVVCHATSHSILTMNVPMVICAMLYYVIVQSHLCLAVTVPCAVCAPLAHGCGLGSRVSQCIRAIITHMHLMTGSCGIEPMTNTWNT